MFVIRLEFDAYRADVEQYNIVPPKDATTRAKAEEARRKFEDHKVKFDRLRGDVAIKLKFLDENRVRCCCCSLVHPLCCQLYAMYTPSFPINYSENPEIHGHTLLTIIFAGVSCF